MEGGKLGRASIGRALPTPTREGYEFAGWFTAAEGGKAIVSLTALAPGIDGYRLGFIGCVVLLAAVAVMVLTCVRGQWRSSRIQEFEKTRVIGALKQGAARR